MIPKLKEESAAPGDGPKEPRILSLTMCGYRVLCGALHTSGTASGQAKERIKVRLASTLWQRHCELTGDRNVSRISGVFELLRDRLGKPRLVVGGRAAPSISFTHVPGTSWAALCHGSQVGIDSVESREFEGPYPFRRAFHEEEHLHRIAATAGTVQQAAALIWSAKEAAVKAAGVGFHLIDPLEVRTRAIFLDGDRSSLEMHLEGGLNEKIGEERCIIKVSSFRYRDGWISIAVTSTGARRNSRAPTV